MSKLRVDIWSDIACPWCYVGKRRLEAALGEFSHASDVEIVWRAFELDPSAPRVRPADESHVQRIARKYGMTEAEASARTQHLTELAAADGLEFRFDRIRSGNTFDAHRLVHFAGELGKQDAMKERLLRAYLTEGQAIGEPSVLLPLAIEAGLPADGARRVLETDAFAAEVRADENLARELGISGVPFFVLGGRIGVSGAQTVEVLHGALERAWAELAAPEFADGAACGPDGCV